MARVVIIGASIGGLPAAYEARELLQEKHKVTVISNVDYFHFVPSNPWLAVNWRTREDITFPIAPYLARKDVKFIGVGAKRVHPYAEPAIGHAGRQRLGRHRASAKAPRSKLLVLCHFQPHQRYLVHLVPLRPTILAY